MVKGRKPFASAIKEASGAYKKDPQRKNHDEPVPVRGWPNCPDLVLNDEVAYSCWQKVCTNLDELKILATADSHLLEQYCLTYSMFVRMWNVVNTGGIAVHNDRGGVNTIPEVAQMNKCSDRLLKMQAELGLTPSARSRLHVFKEEEKDPFQEWMESE
jgi:P27 family predicted phage terminase small subunit